MKKFFDDIKPTLVKLHWFLASQLGLDPLRLISSLRGLLFYIPDLIAFKKSFKGKIAIMPCLNERDNESGAIKGEYFWQDLTVARMIYEANPKSHVDIGSRVDGFVAHVASFRELEVFDIRKNSAEIPGVVFKTIDFSDEQQVNELIGVAKEGYCESVSCLHAIEHFGLGRYGDSLDVRGYEKGIQNLARLLKSQGILYLSTPVGQERVEFNANWVFNPGTIINCAESNDLDLISLHLISGGAGATEISFSSDSLTEISNRRYILALFIFKKNDQNLLID